MKSFLYGCIALVALGVSGRSYGQTFPEIQLIWSGTTGSGVVGTSEIRAEPGDYLTLDVAINVNIPVTVGVLPLSWDSGDLTAFNPQECPGPENPVPGFCTDSSGTIFQPFYPGVTLTSGTAASFDFYNTGFALGFGGQTMYLGRIDFLVESGATTEEIRIDYTIDEPNGISIESQLGLKLPATATILPPCSGCGCPP